MAGRGSGPAPHKSKTRLSLTGFKAAIRFIDHIGASAAANNAAIAVTAFQRLKAVTDLHDGSFECLANEKRRKSVPTPEKLEARG